VSVADSRLKLFAVGGQDVLTIFAQIILFLSSFAPLLVVFGLLDSFSSQPARWVCYGLAFVSMGALGPLFHQVRRLAGQSIEVSRARPRDSDALAYVVTYLIPFLALPTDTWTRRASLVIFIAVVAVLYVRSHLFYVNPILSLVGYRLFEIEADDTFLLLISRRASVRPGSMLNAYRLSDYVFLEEKPDARRGG
jgi:hypothetical protein